jgi:hypothetical protein
LESPLFSFHPSRVHRAIAHAALAVAFCCAANSALAQYKPDGTRVAWTANESGARPVESTSNWGDRLRGALHDKLAPIYGSFASLLRPAAANLTWGGTVHFDGVVPGADGGQPKFSRAFAAGESQGASETENSFSPLMLNPRRFRVPWLVAPSNLFHAMPVMPVAAIGPMHIDFVAATLGINSGTSAALVQFSVRF